MDYLEQIGDIARRAGDAILEVYGREDVGVETKDDKSPLTQADLAAHRLITAELARIAPDIPVLSEESEPVPFAERRQWQRYFLVDPLDGTKEFINRNGEFTVNIALIERGVPVQGVVFVPVQDVLYAGSQLGDKQAYVEREGTRADIAVRQVHEPLTVVASRRHGGDALAGLLDTLRGRFTDVQTRSMGSSLKLCLVAEGAADLYPRLAPTSEWDTAAAHAVVEAAGGRVVDTALNDLRYNTREELLNPSFYVIGDAAFDWASTLVQ